MFWVLFWFLIVVSASVGTWFGALSMLSKVTFNVVVDVCSVLSATTSMYGIVCAGE